MPPIRKMHRADPAKYRRLATIKTEYDLSDVFRHNANIPPG